MAAWLPDGNATFGLNKRGMGEESAVFGGTKSAVFVPPFEKGLLTSFHSELVSHILQCMRKCKKLRKIFSMDS
jgi:hypothetical protein